MRDALSQSAMEYLITYGWSILIVAVVLAALAYLGVFNPLYFAPKAQPGSCQVFRPNGAGTSYDINLLGVCNGEIPEYVSSLNGFPDYISVPDSSSIEFMGENSITMSGWVYLTSYTNDRSIVAEHLCQYYFTVANGGYLSVYFYGVGGYYTLYSSIIPLNKWTYIAATYNGVDVNLYVNGNFGIEYNAPGTIEYCGAPYNRALDIGNEAGVSRQFYGSISNVQIYNTSLDQNSITALYQEGIGGAPIDLQNLAGWWPLNGNANDYSGNGNNGVPTNVVYTGSWISSYNPP
jgi:hypothetical protein